MLQFSCSLEATVDNLRTIYGNLNSISKESESHVLVCLLLYTCCVTKDFGWHLPDGFLWYVRSQPCQAWRLPWGLFLFQCCFFGLLNPKRRKRMKLHTCLYNKYICSDSCSKMWNKISLISHRTWVLSFNRCSCDQEAAQRVQEAEGIKESHDRRSTLSSLSYCISVFK